MSGPMSVLRAFARPVLLVFGALVLYAGAMVLVGVTQQDVYAEAFAPTSDSDPVSDSDADSDSDSDESADTGADEEADGDESTPAPSDPPSPAGAALPSSCNSAFSESMKNTIHGAGLTLNPSWSDGQPSYGLSLTDDTLRGQLATLPQLKCKWLSPEGGGEVGIETTIAVVDSSAAAGITSRLASLGYTAISELGGVRYVWQSPATSDSDAYGESHIVVGGLWFATHWLSYGPSGYTADVVNTVLS
jgi:hypothetical protein